MADEFDPLAMIDGMQKLAEALRGAIAVLVSDGWTEDQARAIILRTFLEPPKR